MKDCLLQKLYILAEAKYGVSIFCEFSKFPIFHVHLFFSS